MQSDCCLQSRILKTTIMKTCMPSLANGVTSTCLFQQINPRCSWRNQVTVELQMQKCCRLSSSRLCRCQQEHFICSNVILSQAKQNHTIKLKTHQTVCFKGISQSINLKEKPFPSLLSCTDSFLALDISSVPIHESTLT